MNTSRDDSKRDRINITPISRVYQREEVINSNFERFIPDQAPGRCALAINKNQDKTINELRLNKEAFCPDACLD